jgi:putative phosphotransacetylase
MDKKEVFVDVSARHIHLTREDQDVLFGKGYELEVYKELAGGGGFASVEQIAIVGPRSTFPKVRILGPCRKQSQVEVSKTDARALGVDAPVRLSGDLEGTPGIKLVGPAGELELEKGVIVAKRHLHFDPKTAEEYGLKDKDVVSVKVGMGTGRETIFNDCVVRVSTKYAPAMHIDTDESNAAGLTGTCDGEILK